MFRVNGWNWTMRRTRSARTHVIATNRITPTGYDAASAFSGPEFIEVNTRHNYYITAGIDF
jgi:hypothetical protein